MYFRHPEGGIDTNLTESTIIAAFIQLLDEKPFKKITVKDIVDRCGVNRNTFYYHFQDIPALCQRVMTDLTDRLIRDYCHPGAVEDCFFRVTEYFEAHRSAVFHVYRSIPRETFVVELNRLFSYMVRSYVEKVAGDLGISPQDQTLLIRYYKCTLVGVFLDWLDSNMNYDLHAGFRSLHDIQRRMGEAGIFVP